MRSDFGIGQGPWSSGQWVALEVGYVDVDLVATENPGADTIGRLPGLPRPTRKAKSARETFAP